MMATKTAPTASTSGPLAKLAAVAKMTNIELWNAARKESQTFESHTAEATKDTFTDAGFAAITRDGLGTLNEFFQLTLRIVLTRINISEARDPLADRGFGEVENVDRGGFTQRISFTSTLPVSPAFHDLQDGQSIDPYVIRKPKVNERFYGQNFDYQNFITLQDFNIKQIFLSNYGFSDMAVGILKGMANGWTIQKYVNKLETLNAALNDPNIKSSQIIGVSYDDTWTDDSLKDFIQTVLDVIDTMTIPAQSSQYNSYSFESIQETGRLKLLIRPGYKNALRVRTLVGAFNKEELNLGIDVIQVENFGGIYYETTAGVRLYPAYGKYGEVIGLNEQEKQNVATHQKTDADVRAVDPNADVVAILADKAFLFETIQNEYRVEAIHNPRGLYNNYWASAPNNGIHYDSLYNFVVFKKASA